MKNKLLVFLLAASMACTGMGIATPAWAQSSASTTVTLTKETPEADTEAPTGSISIDTTSWSKFVEKITFGRIFKERKVVTIASHDNVAVDSVKYYVSQDAMSLSEVQNLDADKWTEYQENGFKLEPVNKYVVYALITDTSGNKTWISSDGLVFISESAPTVNGTEITQTSFKAGISIDENVLDAVSSVGVKYRKKGDTNWTTVDVTEIKTENYIEVKDLQPGTEYEICSFINYTDGTGYVSEIETIRTEATQVPEGKVTVRIKNSTGEVKDAVVKIMQGNKVIAGIEVNDIAGDGSSYISRVFDELPDGVYDIVLTTKDGRFTDTKMIEIKDGSSSDVSFEIIKGKLTNAVEIKGDTPDIAVDGISDVSNDNEQVVSNEEKAEIDAGKISVEIKFEIALKKEAEAEGSAEIEQLAAENGVKADTFLDLSLWKIKTIISGEQAGTETSINVGSVNSQIFKIAIPYDTTAKNIKVYRYHNGQVQALEKLDAMPQESEYRDGTYYIGEGYVYIFASKFSTYAIARESDKAENTNVPDGITFTAPTGADANDARITGVNSSMEYSTDNGTTWTRVTGTEITGLTAGRILIRYAETDTTKPSQATEIVIPSYTAPTPAEKKDGPKAPDASKVKASAPTGKTASDGKITGVDSSMEYSTDYGKTWHDVTGTEITDLSAGEVWIRVKETADTAAGEILKVTIPAYDASVKTTPVKAVKTGDTNNMVIWFTVLVIAAFVFSFGMLERKRSRKH